MPSTDPEKKDRKPLTALDVKNAKPADKPYKLPDGRGMYLLVTPAGGKLWRLNYRFRGKHKTLAIGPYPEISLAEAREHREQARKLVVNGIDPCEKKSVEKKKLKISSDNTFGLHTTRERTAPVH